MNYFPVLALLAGGAIALQASMNGQLGVILGNPFFASTIAFTTSLFFTIIAVVVTTKHYPTIDVIKSVPIYLWFTAGILSSLGISLFYYLIPIMGIGQLMSYALTGQMVIAVIAGHFGWFQLLKKPIDGLTFIGLLALILGIILINRKT